MKKQYQKSATSLLLKHKSIKFPKVAKKHSGKIMNAHNTTECLKTTYSDGHRYNIHSLDVSKYDDFFLSADDLTVNMWRYENSRISYRILDKTPSDMSNLRFVITRAKFKKNDSNTVIVGLNNGVTKSYDLRSRSQADSGLCQVFRPSIKDEDQHSSQYGDVINSIHDFDTTSDGRYLVTRDYLTVKVWDMRFTERPTRIHRVHDYVKPMLPMLNETDNIYDTFDVCISPCDSYVISGSYGARFHTFNLHSSKCHENSLYDTNQMFDSLSNLSAMDGFVINEPVNQFNASATNWFSKAARHYCFNKMHNTLTVADAASLFLHDYKICAVDGKHRKSTVQRVPI